MTYLSTIQAFCQKRGLPVPSAVIGVTERTTSQLAAICNEAIEELGSKDFQVLSSRVTWTSVTGPDQGDITTLFGAGYNRLMARTAWNVTQMQPIAGPLTPQTWQYAKVMPASGPAWAYTIIGNHFLVWPDMTADQTLSVMVSTDLLVADSGGGYSALPVNDSDTFRIPEKIVRAELEWRWLKEKGEAWTASQERAEALTKEHLVADSLPIISLDQSCPTFIPGVWVPAGSWNV